MLRAATQSFRAEASLQKLPAEYVAYILGKYGPYRARLHWREALESAVDLQDLTALLRTQRRYKELMETYYPADDSTNKDYARKAANRVGLAIPDQ